MPQYATAEELASYLQVPLVDTITANLVLTVASGQFSQSACTWFEPTAVTYTTTGTVGTSIRLPFRPVTAVSVVRINGATVTGWTLVKNTLWRAAGFGTSCKVPPDEVEIDLIHGLADPTDDVKGAVLETAATAYTAPIGAVLGEKIDDYEIRVSASAGGVELTSAAQKLAQQYRGTFAA